MLPNYDDIAFFDSRLFGRRGGIWDEAIREALKPKLVVDPSPADTILISPTPEVAGEQPVDGTATPTLHPKAASTEALDIPIPPSPLPELAHRSESAPPTVSASPVPSTPTPGKTWLGSNLNNSASTILTSTGSSDDDSSRGRTLGSTSSDPPLQRSSSVPAAAAEPHAEDDDDEEYLGVGVAASQRGHRGSVGSVSSVSMRSDGTSDMEDAPGQRSRPTTPSSTSGSATGTSPRPQSTFFANLKARAVAAENAPLALQARETMKKWSDTWASRRLSTGAGFAGKADNQSGDEDVITPTASTSSMAATTSSSDGQSTRTNSSASVPTVFGSLRGRFDEMRDAVVARREKEAKEREAAASAALLAQEQQRQEGYDLNGLPESTELSRRDSRHSANGSIGGVSALRAAPSAPTGPVASTTGFVPPTSGAATAVSAVNVAPSLMPAATAPLPVVTSTPPTPIMKQPAAARMMIPGIHASHRNDQMAFGRTASPPPAPPPQEDRSRTLSQATTTVYKLFARNAAAQPGTAEGDAKPLTPAEAQQSLAELQAPTPTAASASPMLPPRPAAAQAPPPLPPRKMTNASPLPSVNPDAALSEELAKQTIAPVHAPSLPPPLSSTPPPVGSSSPASDVLRYVVAQDERRRTSMSHSRDSSWSSSKAGGAPDTSPPESSSAADELPRGLSLSTSDSAATVTGAEAVVDESPQVAALARPPPPLPPRTNTMNNLVSQEVQ